MSHQVAPGTLQFCPVGGPVATAKHSDLKILKHRVSSPLADFTISPPLPREEENFDKERQKESFTERQKAVKREHWWSKVIELSQEMMQSDTSWGQSWEREKDGSFSEMQVKVRALDLYPSTITTDTDIVLTFCQSPFWKSYTFNSFNLSTTLWSYLIPSSLKIFSLYGIYSSLPICPFSFQFLYCLTPNTCRCS